MFLPANTQRPRQRSASSTKTRIHAWHRSCEESQRLEEPGIGPIVATALVAEVGDWHAFSSGRSAAGSGLFPSSIRRAAGPSRRDLKNRQSIFAMAAGRWSDGCYPICAAAQRNGFSSCIMERRPIKVAAVALANKIARIAWAIMVHGEHFKEPRLRR